MAVKHALRYAAAGISVIPIRTDKSKAPAVDGSWLQYQSAIATEEEIGRLFEGNVGIGAVCGLVSGGLEVIDFDSADSFSEWWPLAIETCGEALMQSLLIVKTPRPGFHVFFRTGAPGRSQKLAMTADMPAKVLVETKGEGGYVVLPGSPGECHETGRLYVVHQGRFSLIPQITSEQRESLISSARTLNQKPREHVHHEQRNPMPGSTPGNDYAARTAWDSILRDRGYKFAYRRGAETFWTRPGKEHGVSASTNYHGSDMFHPFSTNCEPFEVDKSYSKFAFLAFSDFGGDFHRTAAHLGSNGYGERRESSEKPPRSPAQDLVAIDDLTERVIALYRTGLQPGAFCGIEGMRNLWTLRGGDWTLITGVPSHGKSAFLDNVMVSTARFLNWRWAVWSAESRPEELHIAGLLSIYLGMPFGEGPTRRMTEDQVLIGMKFIREQFHFLAPVEEDETLPRLCLDTEELMKAGPVQGVTIDPWNLLTHKFHDKETDHIGRWLKTFGKFCKRTSVHGVIVAHPNKPQRDKEGMYPVPTPYDVSGSAHFRNMADCCLCVWRDENAPGTAKVYVQKIRRRHVGMIGVVDLGYNVANGRFYDPMKGGEDDGFKY